MLDCVWLCKCLQVFLIIYLLSILMVNHHPRSAHWAVCLEGAATSSSNDNSIPLEEKIQKYKVYEELDMEANPLL